MRQSLLETSAATAKSSPFHSVRPSFRMRLLAASSPAACAILIVSSGFFVIQRSGNPVDRTSQHNDALRHRAGSGRPTEEGKHPLYNPSVLIAEIKGKAVPELEGVEDLITSSVFGHLRLVPPSGFWADFFTRAKTVEAKSLTESLTEHSIALSAYQRLDMRFWGNFDTYGEPDLLLCFSGGDQEPLLVLIEVKLNSGKSSVGEKDQLAKYMGLIDDSSHFAVWPSEPHLRMLVYLTRAFASNDLCESAQQCSQADARSRMFGMEWNDVLEVSAAHSKDNFLLGEVRDFLKRRGLERFAGFSPVLLPELPLGAFYGSTYFGDNTMISGSILRGGFYEQ